MNNFCLKVVSYTDAATDIEQVRQLVFQIEQNIDPDLDFDGLDRNSVHIIVYQNYQPIGTSRIRYLSETLAKLERVAVLKAFRGKGVGTAMTEKAIAFLQERNVSEVKVNAQIQARDFYEKMGFYQVGQPFKEAGILHLEMRKKITGIQNLIESSS